MCRFEWLCRSGRKSEKAKKAAREQVPVPAGQKADPLDALFRDLERLMDLHGWYTDPGLTLEGLAKHLYTNKHYLSKAIRLHAGESFTPYLGRRRVREAQELMREDPDLRLAQVAFRSGFRSVERFCKVFAQMTGQEVAHWRAAVLSKLT